MIPRVNTLGKSAIIDRRLNSAYDVVEYVADNLPLLIESAHKIQLIANINYVKDHVDNSDIHISSEDREKLNQILSMNNVTQSELNQEINNLTTRIDSIVNSLSSFTSHIQNSDIHLSQEDKETLSRVSNIITSLNAIESRIDALENNSSTVIIDESLNAFSRNPVANKALFKEFKNKVDRASLHKVALTGNYEYLINKPILETSVVKNSPKGITSGAVWDAIQGLGDMNFTSISTDRIDEMFGEEDE
jgi:hypothetical protein